MSVKVEMTKSSGNLFADLGRANPQEEQLKSDLAYRLKLAIRKRGLTQQQAADVLGIDQPKVSALMRGRISGVSVERLLQHLTVFDNDVEIVVHPKAASEEQAVVRVHDSPAALEGLQCTEKDIYTRDPIINGTDEHILLNALGGRWTLRSIMDRDSNSRFGNEIDAALANAMLSIRVFLGLRNGNGDVPSPIRQLRGADGKLYSMESGGRPAIETSRLTFSETAEGRLSSIEAEVRSLAELKRLTRRKLAKYGLAFDDLLKYVEEVRTPAPPLDITYQLNDQCWRTMAKMVCNLFASCYAAVFLRDDFNAIRAYVRDGGGTRAPYVAINLEPVDIDAVGAIGRLDHLLLVHGDAVSGEVTGLVVLYRYLQFVIRLGVTHLPADVTLSYRLDQIGRDSRQNDPRDCTLRIPPFPTIDPIKETAAIQPCLEALNAVVHELHDKIHRDAIVKQIVTEWAADVGEGTVVTQADWQRLSRMVGERIAEYYYGQGR